MFGKEHTFCMIAKSYRSPVHVSSLQFEAWQRKFQERNVRVARPARGLRVTSSSSEIPRLIRGCELHRPDTSFDDMYTTLTPFTRAEAYVNVTRKVGLLIE